eukprot:499033_1
MGNVAKKPELDITFHVNDTIEINYAAKWRQATIETVKRENEKFKLFTKLDKSLTKQYNKKQRTKLQAIQILISDIKNKDKLQWIIIDNKKQTFCDCYDICTQTSKYKHRIRLDNKQSLWSKNIKSFISNANTILQQEINFYRNCTNYWNKIKSNQGINIDDVIIYHTKKYNEFMLTIAAFIKEIGIKKNIKASSFVLEHFFAQKLISLNIIYFWRVHMMHPFVYKDDCMKHFGFVLSPTLHEYITNVSDEKEINYTHIYSAETTLFTRFNFNKSLKKNVVFMGNVLKQYNNNNFYDYIADYKDFLYFSSYFCAKSQEYNIDVHLAPLIMRDFVWHSHQMFPDKYFKECPQYTHDKMCLDHDDLIPEEKIKKYISFSEQFWNFVYKYKDKMRSGKHEYLKERLADMVGDALNVDNRNSLLVFGYLATMDEMRKYPAEIVNLCLEFYNKTTKWSIQVTPTPSLGYDPYGAMSICC